MEHKFIIQKYSRCDDYGNFSLRVDSPTIKGITYDVAYINLNTGEITCYNWEEISGKDVPTKRFGFVMSFKELPL
jgi:hypothetical protein